MRSELELCYLLMEHLETFIEEAESGEGSKGPYCIRIETLLYVLDYATPFYDGLPPSTLIQEIPYELKKFMKNQIEILEKRKQP